MNAARKNPIFLKINVYHSRSTNLICKNIIGGIGGTEFTMAKNKLSLADLSRQRKKVLEEIDESPPTSNFTEIESSQTSCSISSTGESPATLSRADETKSIQFKNEDEAGKNGKRLPQVETTESTLTVNRNPDINHSPVEIEVSEETKGPGRPKSLRSDPNYETTTIFLHRGTKAKARYHLATQEQKQDLQVLINDLLEDWVTKREQNSANI
ncbi:hypothetical protein C7B62_08725 [Pleurocapsa sp. CCALA 161]|nr:hypothetical protein C7B62_08725 [Pleurocapsa sp. CCALA 161]